MRRDHELRFPWWGWVGLGAALVALIVVAVQLWQATGETQTRAAAVGDAAAIVAALVTACALVATMWQARLQRVSIDHQLDELELQRKEMAASSKALNDQVAEQRELLAHQRTFLEHERREAGARRLSELRAAYAAWIVAMDLWLGEELRAVDSIRHPPMITSDFDVHAVANRERDERLDAAYGEVIRAQWGVVLNDPSPERRGDVDLLSQRLLHSPTATNAALAQYERNVAAVHEKLVAFSARLRTELGTPVDPSNAPAVAS